MKRTIFYSWQSDLDNGTNRNLVEDVLKRVLKALKRDDSDAIEPVLDRDTSGLAGSPDIANSILAKIAMADVFVADVSIINSGTSNRPTPNPNVLIELGYASSQLGWDRIVLVQNTAFGGPDSLPFDLRGRRVITYNCDPGSRDRGETRGLLQGRMEAALRAAMPQPFADSLAAKRWWGHWKIDDHGQAFRGHLFIRDVDTAGFSFDLLVVNGSHTGTISAYSSLVSNDVAYCRVPEGSASDGAGEIAFRRAYENGRHLIRIQETADCSRYHGMGALFSGDFSRSTVSLFELGFINEAELSRIYQVTGEHYEKFMERMQGISEHRDLDLFGARVYSGGVRGLYSIMEGILMISGTGAMWIAFLDGDEVRYFTTQPAWKGKLPKTIDDWRSRFANKAVVQHPFVEAFRDRPL